MCERVHEGKTSLGGPWSLIGKVISQVIKSCPVYKLQLWDNDHNKRTTGRAFCLIYRRCPFFDGVYRPSSKVGSGGAASQGIPPGMHNLNRRDTRDKEISTQAYAFNGYRLNYYVSSNYRWQIHYAEI